MRQSGRRPQSQQQSALPYPSCRSATTITSEQQQGGGPRHAASPCQLERPSDDTSPFHSADDQRLQTIPLVPLRPTPPSPLRPIGRRDETICSGVKVTTPMLRLCARCDAIATNFAWHRCQPADGEARSSRVGVSGRVDLPRRASVCAVSVRVQQSDSRSCLLIVLPPLSLQRTPLTGVAMLAATPTVVQRRGNTVVAWTVTAVSGAKQRTGRERETE